jgi:uncharacterized Zn finger protein
MGKNCPFTNRTGTGACPSLKNPTLWRWNMECPNGCGDMEQLVSVSNDDNEKSHRKRKKIITFVYERCRECGYVEPVKVETHQE